MNKLINQTKSTISTLAIASFLFAGSVFAAPSGFMAKPFEYVGAAGDCGPGYPAGSNIVTAAWQTHQGLPDAGASDHALFLEKNGLTTDCSSAGATIEGVSGITLSEIGWDVRDDGHCGAGAPRFNVTTSDDATHFIGCNSPAPVSNVAAPGSPDANGNTWTRKRYDPTTAFPPIVPGSTIKSISIVFDEGTDQGTGSVYLDNIDVNGVLMGKPGNTK